MNYNELKSIIVEEKTLYVGNELFQKITHQKQYTIWRYLASFRKAQFWNEELGKNDIRPLQKIRAMICKLFYCKKKNILSEKTNIEIANGCKIGRKLDICHGGVVINADLGDDCVLHGNNILGNKGIGKEGQRPIIGNGVDIGAGAVIIGNVTVADKCIVGAGAVLTKSITNEGAIVVGVPAKERK